MKIKTFLIFLSLSISCFIVYFNAFNAPFIWDDLALIENNSLLRDWHLWKQVFSSDLYYHVASGSNFYRPLQSLTYIWDYHFWQLDPFGYHLTNIILQIFASFLVFLLIYRLLGNLRVSFLTASLFAVCPLAVESVAYISGRAEMLMGISLLGSLLFFISFCDKRGSLSAKLYLLFSIACFICGLFSKELSAVFPFIILGYAYYLKRERIRQLFIPILAFFIVDLIYLALRVSLLNFSTYRPPALSQFSFLTRLSVIPNVLLSYLKLLIFPLNLHMSRTIGRPVGILSVLFSLIVFCAVIIFLAVSLRKKNKGVYPFMLLWGLLFLLPQSGILPINAFVSDHFLYLTSISFFLLISFLLFNYLKKPLFIIAAAGLVLYYAALTISRNFDWLDPVVFYKKMVYYSPGSFQGHNNLGLQYEYRHQYDLAIEEYNKALEIKPDLLEAHSNLANIYFKTGKLAKAKEEYAIVEKIAPKMKAGEIQNNIGCVLESEGNFGEALKRYRAALQLDPELYFTHFNIAKLILKEGRLEEASLELLKSLPPVDPPEDAIKALSATKEFLATRQGRWDSASFYNDWGIKFARSGLMAEASSAFNRAIELEPRYADAHYNLGLSFLKRGMKRKASFEFKKAMELKK